MSADKRMDPITARIETLRKQTGLSRRAFCNKIGFSYARYHHLAGVRLSRPPVDLLAAVVRYTGVNWGWLFTGEDSLGSIHISYDENFIPIPFYSEARTAMAGGASKDVPFSGRLASNHLAGDTKHSLGEREPIPFDRPPQLAEDRIAVRPRACIALHVAWLRRELGLDVEQLSFICVRGEAMRPTLYPGDLLLMEHKPQRPHSDGIYLLRIQDALLLKRLQFLPHGTIRVSSDNPAYQPFEIYSQKFEESPIVGRVVWISRKC